MSDLKHIPMNENHRRSVAITLGILDEMLCQFERWAHGAQEQSILYKECNTLTEKQRKDILNQLAAIRLLLSDLKWNLDLPSRITHVNHTIWGWCSCFWESLVELESKHLKGYGEVPPKLAVYLDPRVKILIERLTEVGETARGMNRTVDSPMLSSLMKEPDEQDEKQKKQE